MANDVPPAELRPADADATRPHDAAGRHGATARRPRRLQRPGTPAPAETKKAGKEEFSVADTTAVCA